MAKFKFPNMSSLFTRNAKQTRIDTNPEDIVMKGSLAKMESSNTKYFVLRKESEESPACLEYYENIEKFNDHCQPRKRYLLKDCYISRTATEKKEFVFALFIKKKCKTLIANSEQELMQWLDKLHALKREISECSNSGSIEYQRIWCVEIMNRGLAPSHKLSGELLVCLNNWSLWLMITENDMKEIPFHSIKNYGRINEFFYLEVGRQSGIGAGIMWMKTEDAYIAQNMLDIIKGALHDCESLHQRGRVNSEGGSKMTPGLTTVPRGRTQSDGRPLPHIVNARGAFCGNPNTPSEVMFSLRDVPGTSRLPASSEEDNIGSSVWQENEYVRMSAGDVESPSTELLSSPIFEIQSPSSAYLEMGPTTSEPSNKNRIVSTPIPIVNNSDSLHHEISPLSGNSSATSATTSSDHMPDLDGTSGSESNVGNCFGASELLDRPIRTSSVGSKIEQYKRKNSAPLLAWSPASHSWSGTSGTYFRNVPEMISHHKKDTMMIDYSNPNINHEGKEKKKIWATFGGQRLRSNSKSSRTSNAKICDSKEESRPIEVPDKKRSDDYCEVDYHVKISGPDSSKPHYVPMSAPKFRSGNSLERKIRLDPSYLEMSPTAEPGTDGYVDMSKSGSSLSVTDMASSAPTHINFNPVHKQSTLHALLPEKNTKNNHKKATKSKSMKESSSKRSKSEADKVTPDLVEPPAKSKGGTFSVFTRKIRKTSTSKSPVNINLIKRSPPSPINNLPRRTSKDSTTDETEGIKVFPSSLPPTTSGFIRMNERDEEKMLFVPREDTMPPHLRKISEMSIKDGERTQSKMENRARLSLTDTPDCTNRNYVNLSLNASSPQISQYGRQPSFPDVSPRLLASAAPKSDGYLLMSSTVAGPTRNKEHGNAKVDSGLQCDSSYGSTERSRSLSGPGKPIDEGSKDKKNMCERTTSATSSPTSRSPPGGLGSISSISSLGEGGLSSGSSTCTVVNVGTARAKYPSGGLQDTKVAAIQDSDKARPASLNINYASLDLSKTPEGSPRPGRSSRDTSKDSNYCEVDFVKSEGLRNTALARNSAIQ